MSKNKPQTDLSITLVIDPLTEKCLGEIHLAGDSMPASDWIDASGELQSYSILGSRSELWQIWVNQKEVLLRTKLGQRPARIITYPAEGETEGYLDYIGVFEAYPSEPEAKHTVQKGLAFIQSLLGT